MIIPAKLAPGAIGNFVKFHETPVAFTASSPNSKVIPNGRRNINSRTVVLGVSGACPAEYIGPVVGSEGAYIGPLRITYPAAAMNGDPPHVTHGFSFPLKGPAEPGDNPFGAGFRFFPIDPVIIWQGDIEGVESWDEALRAKVGAPVGGVWVIVSPVVLFPLGVPGTGRIVCRVGGGGFLADPENGSGNIPVPGVDGCNSPGEGGRVGAREVCG